MSDAATTSPSASGTGVGRTNGDTKRARIGIGLTCAPEVPCPFP
jgi:hypothetical protein